jgi:uncharacterized membrane protein YedE/YeeE
VRQRRWVPFASGVLFALGLGLSRMTDPEKVLAFLDVRGDWDPTLAWVIVTAIVVHVVGRRLVLGPAAFEARFESPERIGASAVLGAAIFGVGWGLSGYCPGPAITSAASGAPGALWTLGAMLVGIALHDFLVFRRKSRESAFECGGVDLA